MEEKRRILIVDDMPSNIKILADVLKTDYRISVATSGREALELASGDAPPDLILLDVLMPEMDGYEVCRRLKLGRRTRDIPVLFVTAMAEVEDETKGLLAGGVDYITKPVSAPIVKARVRNHMQLKLHQDHLEELVQSRTRELALTQDVTIHGLASLAETRDNETGRHLLRTQHYVRILALQLKDHPNFRDYLDETTVEMLYKSAPLHDIGKVGVPDAILLKPGRLDEDEFEEMKQHACHGRDAILRAAELMGDHAITSFLRYALEITYTHHERWDGTGYPQGLAGSDIPISGRLMAVADVYDALISRRVYKPPLTHERAVEIMRQSRGSHFDPDALDAFLEIEDRFRGIAMQYADQDEPGDSLC